jgi:hypothetical protein
LKPHSSSRPWELLPQYPITERTDAKADLDQIFTQPFQIYGNDRILDLEKHLSFDIAC